jgi:formylglycine-generating enzyme required for sulfatase activity
MRRLWPFLLLPLLAVFSCSNSDRPPKFPPELAPIAGGTFSAGADLGTRDNHEREVTVEPFAIMRFEVTVTQYRECVKAGRCKAVELPPTMDDPDLPVVNTPYGDATAYCAWRGLRLPTENEWERAARGPQTTLYPWGPDFSPDAANGGHAIACSREKKTYRFTAPADCFPADVSAYGVRSMAGNAAEWVSTVYSPEPENPGDPAFRVVKGGSYYSEPAQQTGAWREPALAVNPSLRIGFRCASAAP